MIRIEPDNKIELREILRPLHLSLGQYLSSRKILKVFMICNNIDGISWTFQVVSSNFKSFKNGNKFLVMHIVVQLHCGESIGVEDYQMNFIFFVNNGKDCNKNIVQSISFHDELSIGNPMSENEGRDECLLEKIESITTEGVELSRDILLDEIC